MKMQPFYPAKGEGRSASKKSTHLLPLILVSLLEFASLASADPAHLLHESEDDGRLTKDPRVYDDATKTYSGRWENGTGATVKITHKGGNRIELRRGDSPLSTFAV